MTGPHNLRRLCAGFLSAPAVCVCLLVLLVPGPADLWSQGTLHRREVRVKVRDQQGNPKVGVWVQASAAGAEPVKAITAKDGTAAVTCSQTVACAIQVSPSGYLPAHITLDPGQNNAAVEIALQPAVQARETVSVHADARSPVTEASSTQTTLAVEPAKTSALRPMTLVDTLPLVPGVIRTADGRVKIAGLDELHSTLLVNSVNVTDPATGGFGLSVPIDSVEVVKVAESPYLAQYGNFTAGVVSAETKRGGDKWSYSLNDPLPEFRIRSGHVEGLRDTTPRLNFDGPLIKNHLYFLEATEYLLNKTEVRTLPWPVDETRSKAINSFTQLDQILTPTQTLTGTLHFAPHSLDWANLNYFDPRPVTPNADYQEDTGTLLHRWALGKSLLSSTLAVTRVATNVGPQASGEMFVSPLGDAGSYFGRQNREATRIQWLETWSPGTLQGHGQHVLTIGSVLAHAEDSGNVSAQPVTIRDAGGHVLRQIAWSGPGSYSLADFEPALYAQDHWLLRRDFALDLGVRAETQSLTYTQRFAPRGGFSWAPQDSSRTMIRGGIGVFYDEVPLDVYAFSSYPQQIVTTYNGNGQVVDGPRTYLNVISTAAESEFPFFAQKHVSGNFAPYSVAWNLSAERTLVPAWTLRLEYLQSSESNQLVLQPHIAANSSALVLGDSGSGQLRQMEVVSRLGNTPTRQFFFSYVRQLSRGNVSDAESYLGDFPTPVVRSPIVASNAGEIPNRFLLWGLTTLPWRMRIAPRVELRNGFPWEPVDALQNYVDFASYLQPRFPRYFSADARVSKDLDVLGTKHAIRLSVTGTNLTNHFNPLQVHANIDDPQYRNYFGNYTRHFILDCDLLF